MITNTKSASLGKSTSRLSEGQGQNPPLTSVSLQGLPMFLDPQPISLHHLLCLSSFSLLSTHQVIQTPSLPQAVTLFTKRGSTSMGSGIRIWVSWGYLVQLSQHLCVALRQWRKLGGRHYGNITVKPLSSLLVSWANHCNNHCALLRHYTRNRQPLVGLGQGTKLQTDVHRLLLILWMLETQTHDSLKTHVTITL